MDETLVPRLLDRATIDQAFPLVHALVPAITHDRWVRFARPQVQSRSADWPRGLMTIQNPSGYILGLFCFDVRDDLQQSRVLCIDNMIVPNIPGREAIWSAIVDTADNLAKMNGCGAIRAGFADELDPAASDRAWIVAALGKSGYLLEGVRACKRLNAAPGLLAGPKSNGSGGGNAPRHRL